MTDEGAGRLTDEGAQLLTLAFCLTLLTGVSYCLTVYRLSELVYRLSQLTWVGGSNMKQCGVVSDMS